MSSVLVALQWPSSIMQWPVPSVTQQPESHFQQQHGGMQTLEGFKVPDVTILLSPAEQLWFPVSEYTFV